MQLLFVRGTQRWEINRIGARYIARWGENQSAVHDFDSEQLARESIEGLISGLLRDGYIEQPGSFQRREDLRWNPELEATILERAGEASACLVYADWLQANSNPLGELIALQHAGHAGTDFIDDHFESFFGRAATQMRKASALSLEWKNGFVDGLRAVGKGDGEALAPVLNDVLSSPASRLIRRIVLGLALDYEDYDAVPTAELSLATVIANAPRLLERLEVADFDNTPFELGDGQVGDASGLWRATPALVEVVFRGAGLVLGDVVAPQLRRFTIESDGLDADVVRSVVNAKWPKLESLTLSLGKNITVRALEPIFDASGLPGLTALALKNTELTDAVIARLADSKVLAQLRTLDVSKGVITEAGAQVLRAKADRFRHLERLDIRENRSESPPVLNGLGINVVD